MRGRGGGGVAQDHETGRDNGQEAGRQKEEAEQGNNVGLAAVAVATAEQEEEGGGRGKDIAQDHPAMTVVNQAGEESKQWIYHIAGNFGEVFNLAIWQILQRSPN